VATSLLTTDNDNDQKRSITSAIKLAIKLTIKLNKIAQLTQGLRHSKMVGVPRWLSPAILDIIEPAIAPFDPPTPKTLA